MVALGVSSVLGARLANEEGGARSAALFLCVAGLLAVFAVGYPGYFLFDAIWPSFYYSPVPAGKNWWLVGQATGIAIYVIGTLMMFSAVRNGLNEALVDATRGSGWP